MKHFAGIRKKRLFVFFTLLATCSFILHACMIQKSVSNKTLVLVSAPPYATVIHKIAGDLIDVISIVSPDVDPHTWEPKLSEVAPFARAKAWFTIGESFEPSIVKKFHETNPSMDIVDLAKVVQNPIEDPHEHHHEMGIDTHFWLDPVIMVDQAKAITEELSKLLPDHSPTFAKNLKMFTREMQSLNEETKKKLAPFQGYAFVTTHSAFTYYARQYGLKQITIEPGTGKEPGGKDVARILEEVQSMRGQVVGVLLQPQHLNVAAERVAETEHLPIFIVNPYALNFVDTIKELTAIVLMYE